METILVFLVSIAIVIIGTLTIAMTSLNSINGISDSWKNMEEQAHNIRLTEIVVEPPVSWPQGYLDLTVRNEGQTDMAQFSRWDVIAEYTHDATPYITYLEYTTANPPGSNQWTISGFYLFNDDAEIVDPNILNPGEKMIMLTNLLPALSSNESASVTIATPNGVTSEVMVSKP